MAAKDVPLSQFPGGKAPAWLQAMIDAEKAAEKKPEAPKTGAPPPNQPAPDQGRPSPAAGAKYIGPDGNNPSLSIWQLPDGNYIRATADGKKWMGTPETVAAAEKQSGSGRYTGVDGKTYESSQLPFPGAIFAGGSADGRSTFWQDPATGKIRTVNSETNMLPQDVDRPKPPPTRSEARARVRPTGSTIGEDEDYRSMASSVLKRLGFENEAMNMLLGESSTDAEVDMFIRGGMKDSESIERYYRTKPSLLAVNPGLKYNLGREEYFRTRAAVETAFGQTFDEPSTAAAMRAKAANPTVGPAPAESDWVSAFFQEKFSPEESAGMFGDYFKRVGVAPTAKDIGLYRTRSKEQYRDKAVEPAFRDIEDGRRGGPTTPGLTDPKRNQVFGRR